MRKKKLLFWDLLNVGHSASVKEIDIAYQGLYRNKLRERSNVRFAWKILRDPFFSSSYSFYKSKKVMIEAGFFDDKIEPDDTYFQFLNPYWLTTPTIKIQKNLEKLKNKRKHNLPLVVLLTTGGFSPIHNGHLSMMEIAKKELEKNGRIVVGGYISPSHDEYVLNKYQEKLLIPSSHYLYLCQKVIEKSSWLMVDSWESKFNKFPITYTEVMSRLSNYLNTHFGKKFPVEVVYVFGSDNANFAKAFIGNGTCVCVERPGYEENMDKVKGLVEIKNNKNIFFVKDKTSKNISSRLIRNKNISDFQFSSKDLFKQWKINITEKINSKMESYTYCIRNDFDYGVKPWISLEKSQALEKAGNTFKIGLKKIFKEGFRNPNLPDLPSDIFIYFIDLNKQQEWVNELSTKGKILNLDSCTESKYKINISRLFGISDSQIHATESTIRPGYKDLEVNLRKIPSGKYVFVDDDISSRETIRLLKSILPKRIQITNYVSLLKKSLKFSSALLKHKGRLLDVVDLRDFILGTKDSGLVVLLPNGIIARAPYMLPYVSLASRAKIPYSRELLISLNLWKLNVQFFKDIKQEISLKYASEPFRNLMRYIGFKDEASMVDICNWHISYLENTTNALER